MVPICQVVCTWAYCNETIHLQPKIDIIARTGCNRADYWQIGFQITLYIHEQAKGSWGSFGNNCRWWKQMDNSNSERFAKLKEADRILTLEWMILYYFQILAEWINAMFLVGEKIRLRPIQEVNLSYRLSRVLAPKHLLHGLCGIYTAIKRGHFQMLKYERNTLTTSQI